MESLFRLIECESFATVASKFLLLATIYILWYLLRLRYCSKTTGQRLPGPKGLPLVGYLPFLGPEPHKTLWKLREKYGDMFGVYLGKYYTVVLNEYNVFKEVLCHPGALDRNQEIFKHIPQFGFGNANGDEWLEQRRFCLTTIRDLGLGKGRWEDMLTEETAEFVNFIQKLDGQPADISDALSSSASSNILSLLIGRRLAKEEEAEKIQNAREFVDKAFTYIGSSVATSVIPGLRKFCRFFKLAGYDKAYQAVSQFSSFVRDEIWRHKTSTEYSTHTDFINIYLEKMSNVNASKSKKHYFSDPMLEGNVILLFANSTDTLCISVGWLLRLMVKYKDVQEKVYSEVMEVLGKDRITRYEERHIIPYTFAVLMEAQRISSIVTLSTTRRATQDIHIRGYVIPKGSDIIGNLWGMHNDAAYWDEPEVFRPERFLTDGGTKIVKDPPNYAPFSLGKRNCPGYSIAWRGILFYFVEIIKNFEISTPPGVEPEFNSVSGLVSHLTGQPLCFKLRKDK